MKKPESNANQDRQMPDRRWSFLFLAFILLFTISFRLLILDRPFCLDNEGLTSFYGVLARNYFNFKGTWGIPILTVGQISGVPVVDYPTHSPVVPLLIASCYFFFGCGEWQTRFFTSIATIAAVYLLFLLLDRYSTRRIALLGSALYAAAPMTLYYGGSPEVVSMPLVLFILLSLYAYLNFYSQPSKRTLLMLIGAFCLAAISDWPAFIIVPVFLIHFITTCPRYRWSWILTFCLSACLFFSLLYLYIMLATGRGWDWIISVFRNRSFVSLIAPDMLTEWLPKVAQYNRNFHTIPLLLASGTWIIALSWRWRRFQPGATIARILLAWGGLHVLIGYQGVFLHDWWWAPLTPGLAVSAALTVDWIIRFLEKRGLVKIAHYGAVLLVGLFASWNAETTYQKLDPFNSKNSFVIELGEAIRIASPKPNDIALLSCSGYPSQVWFYGNRPLRFDVYTPDKLTERLQDECIDLPYGLQQPCTVAATGMVLININPVTGDSDQNMVSFRAYLRQNYPSVPLPPRLTGKFEVFDLTRPLNRN